MDINRLQDAEIRGKTVLLRADLNVPVKDGTVTDSTRIDRVRPTIDFLREKGCKIMVLSHFGRPKGEHNDEFSLAFLPPALEKSWGVPVAFANDCIGGDAEAAKSALGKGEVVLLENTRFHPGEKSNDAAFAKQLASLGDIYVNDAFSAAHRAHASTEGITHHLPSYAGLLMDAEITALNDALGAPERPVIAFVGGAKISTKLSVLKNLSQKVDYLCLGGGMANTFLYAKSHDLGKSLCEKDMVTEAREILDTATQNGCRIVLPEDLVVVSELKENAEHSTVRVTNVPTDKMAVDTGSATVTELKNLIDECNTVLWNGPLGVFEIKPFDTATNEVARHVAKLTRDGELTSVAGGGDTVAALENAGSADDFSYISTAGGAFLEWLEGKTLPGVAALMKNREAA